MTETPLRTEALWELLSQRLRGFFVRQVRDPQLADDLLQDTFVRIHQGLERLADSERVEAWVFQIARRVLIDHRRGRAALPGAAPDEPSALEALPFAEPPGEENLNERVGQWLPDMIAQLPAIYRRPLQLVELEGVSQVELAARLGLGLSAAKSRVQRGREKLKALLFACCSFERDRRGNLIGFERRARAPCEGCDEERAR